MKSRWFFCVLALGASMLCPAAFGSEPNPNQVAILKWYAANLSTNFAVGYQPTGIAFDGSHIWVVNNSSDTVTEIQPSDGAVLGTFPVGSYPVGIAYDGTNIWVANGGYNSSGSTVTVLSATTGQPPFSPVMVGQGPRELVFDGFYMWVANSGTNTVTKVQANTGVVVNTYIVGANPECMAFDGTNIWVSNRGTNTVTKLSELGVTLGTFTVGNGPFGIAFDGSYIWVANGSNVTKLTLAGAIKLTVAVAGGSEVAFDGVNIWVTNQSAHTVTKILASSGKILNTFSFSGNPWGLAFDGANIWVSNFVGSNVWKL
jgi:YVTN family beta-propeller protein